MGKVYIVTKDSHDDFEICHVFSMYELAQAHVDQGGGDNVEEFELRGTIPRRYEKQRVWVDWEGHEEHRDTLVMFTDDEPIECAHKSNWRFGGKGVYAETHRGFDVALKIARDKLAELKAQEAGM